MGHKLPFQRKGQCAQKNIVLGSCYRITVLTSQLLRLEYSADGVFEDRPTLMAVNRDFPVVPFDM